MHCIGFAICHGLVLDLALLDLAFWCRGDSQGLYDPFLSWLSIHAANPDTQSTANVTSSNFHETAEKLLLKSHLLPLIGPLPLFNPHPKNGAIDPTALPSEDGR